MSNTPHSNTINHTRRGEAGLALAPKNAVSTRARPASPLRNGAIARLTAMLILVVFAIALSGCGTNAVSTPVGVTEAQPQAVLTALEPTSVIQAPSTAIPATAPTEWVPPTALVGTPRPGAEATLTAAPKLQTGVLTITNRAGEKVAMTVEIADTEASRQLGLMHRASMDPNAGMLFSWTEDVEGGFWMYNTILPLSIAFISADGTILNVADMQALDTNTTPPAGPYRYALETNQGFFAAHNIVAGDKVTVPSQQAVVIPGMPGCCCDPSASAP